MTKEQEQMIEDCEKRSGQLSDWETGFIDSISRLEVLSENQAAKLDQIWERVTDGG